MGHKPWDDVKANNWIGPQGIRKNSIYRDIIPNIRIKVAKKQRYGYSIRFSTYAIAMVTSLNSRGNTIRQCGLQRRKQRNFLYFFFRYSARQNIHNLPTDNETNMRLMSIPNEIKWNRNGKLPIRYSWAGICVANISTTNRTVNIPPWSKKQVKKRQTSPLPNVW